MVFLKNPYQTKSLYFFRSKTKEKWHITIWKFRTGHETTEWFQTGKGVCQVCILSPYLFNLYAEYIMRNAGLEETKAGIKIAGTHVYLWQIHFDIWQN